MKVTTDYTAEANKDSLKGGAFEPYRLMYWLKNIVENFMSDPINLHDDRICKMLNFQDGDTPEKLDALFDIGVTFSERTHKACTTPMIIISIGDTQYPVRGITEPGCGPTAINGAIPMYKGSQHKVLPLFITVITEKYDSTVVLTSAIENYLIINSNQLVEDNGMISEFHVQSVSAPQMEEIGKASNAKPVYLQKISIIVTGGISWVTDTQGPVFRGVQAQLVVK